MTAISKDVWKNLFIQIWFLVLKIQKAKKEKLQNNASQAERQKLKKTAGVIANSANQTKTFWAEFLAVKIKYNKNKKPIAKNPPKMLGWGKLP